MLNILGMIILIIILFITLLLIIGIRISLEYVKNGSEFKGCIKILIFKKIKIYTLNFPAKDKTDEENKKEEKDRDIKKLFNLAKPCLRDLLDYLKTVIKSISIKNIQNHLIFGMASYTDTGKYIGIIWGVFSIINTFDKNLKLSAQPSFTGSVLDAKGVNEFEIYPLKIVIPTIRLILKKEVRQLIRGVLDER